MNFQDILGYTVGSSCFEMICLVKAVPLYLTLVQVMALIRNFREQRCGHWYDNLMELTAVSALGFNSAYGQLAKEKSPELHCRCRN